MGRRSYAMRHYRRSRSRYYSSSNTGTGGAVVLLLLAGFFTWGLTWVMLVVWACIEAPPLKMGDFRTRKPAPQPPAPVPTPEGVKPFLSTEPPVRSTAWAYSPRNLGSSIPITTDRICKPDDGPPPVGSQDWLDALDYPESQRDEVKRNRARTLDPKSRFVSLKPTKGVTQRGPRGGRYRMVVSKDGKLYRQYF